MPAKQARSGTRGRPPLGLGGSTGNNGWITRHNSSDTKGATMPDQPGHYAPGSLLLGALSPTGC